MQHSDPSPLIRPATETDLTAIGRLGALLVQTHHDFDAARFIPAAPGTEYGYASFLRTQLREPNVVILVAEQEGEVCGYAYMSIEGHDYMALRGPAGVLHDLAVDSAHRGQGIGRQLLEAARGTRQVVLQTAESNVVAQHLFKHAGFRRTMIEMTCDLDDPGT